MSGVAIVTGASKGIGFETAKLLVQRNFKLTICSRNANEIKAVGNRLGKDVLALGIDISKPEQCRDLFDKTLSRFGKLDFLVNNAGIGLSKPLSETTESEIDSVIDINLKAMVYCCKYACQMIKRGAIVNISSIYGKAASANASVYCASKFGVIGLTKALSQELYPRIKFFAVCPGAVETDMLRNDFRYTGKAIQPSAIGEVVVELLENWEKRESGQVIDAFR